MEGYRLEPFDDDSGYFAVFPRETDEFIGRIRETGGNEWYYLDCTMQEQGRRRSRESAIRRLEALFQRNFGGKQP